VTNDSDLEFRERVKERLRQELKRTQDVFLHTATRMIQSMA
jgi:hypothetical protein